MDVNTYTPYQSHIFICRHQIVVEVWNLVRERGRHKQVSQSQEASGSEAAEVRHR